MIGFIAPAALRLSSASSCCCTCVMPGSSAWPAVRRKMCLPCKRLSTKAPCNGAPKAMTVAVILAGLFPLFVGAGAGSEVMQRIAAPMLGGMLTAPVLSMVVIPAAFYLVRRRGLRAARATNERQTEHLR